MYNTRDIIYVYHIHRVLPLRLRGELQTQAWNRVIIECCPHFCGECTPRSFAAPPSLRTAWLWIRFLSSLNVDAGFCLRYQRCSIVHRTPLSSRRKGGPLTWTAMDNFNNEWKRTSVFSQLGVSVGRSPCPRSSRKAVKIATIRNLSHR